MKIPEDVQKIKKEKYVNKKGSESEIQAALSGTDHTETFG